MKTQFTAERGVDRLKRWSEHKGESVHLREEDVKGGVKQAIKAQIMT